MIFNKVFKTDFFTIESSKSEYNQYGPYYRIKSSDSVIVCLIDRNENLILVSQFRPNLQKKTLEFPAGHVDKDENIFQAATREVFEETGYNCKLLFIGKSRLLMNRYINYEHLFIGIVDEHDLKNSKKDIFLTNRKKFIKLINQSKFEQLAALGLLNYFNIKFNLNFFEEDSLYEKINILRERQHEDKKN